MFRIHNINEQNKKRPDFHQNQAVINAISFVFYLFEDKRRDKPAIKQVCLFLVGVTGLEPAASWSQTKRATKLRYTPIKYFQLFNRLSNGCII